MKIITNSIIRIIKLIIIILFYLIFYYSYNINELKNYFINILKYTKYNNSNLFQLYKYFNYNELNIKYINISIIYYSFSFKFKKVKIKYEIHFLDENKNLILPSKILYHNLQLFCYIKDINNNSINTISNIYQNKYFYCIEFFNINEDIKIGIELYKNNKNKNNINAIYYIDKNFYNYNKLKYLNDNIFDPLFIKKQYNFFINKIKNKKNNYLLKQIYIRYPICNLKRNIYLNNTNNRIWIFKNIYNHYFCFHVGNNYLKKDIIAQECKYFFYVSIIDNNVNLYNKTNYLFVDFIFNNMPNDDTYPIFKEMIKQNIPSHFVTEKKNIYNEYCNNKKDCLTIIPLNRKLYYNYGDFIQKYFIIFLKLRAVISAKLNTFHNISLLFYKLEYITYISVGHGVCFFKYFLYDKNRLYGIKTNNKILLPNSQVIISIAKRYGWKDKDIIKMNLPRWDKYNNLNKSIVNNNNIGLKTNSIFIMFTWRDVKINKTISFWYIKNIINLLRNNLLNRELIKNNIILYFSLHRFMYYNYKNIFNFIIKSKKNIQLINQFQISECLSKTNLAISDFSSIVFDVMYRRKPIIIYIPDAYDPNIKNIYSYETYILIQLMKKRKIYFENNYFGLNRTINKIIYYINNNFTIDEKLQKFYDIFRFKAGNNINNFIEYLKSIK